MELDGDGAGGLVEAWGSRELGDGRVAVALWNVTLRPDRLHRRAPARPADPAQQAPTAASYELRHSGST